jgi:hypothetical protein
MSLVTRWRTPIVALVITQTAGGCATAGGGAPESERLGFLVLGPTAAVRFGFAPGDTADEVPARQVLAVVRDSAQTQARGLGYDPGCARYFSLGQRYVVLLTVNCELEDSEDGEALAAFEGDGRMISWPTPTVTDMEIRELKPPRRRRQ